MNETQSLIIDDAYLSELKEWVGHGTLAELAFGAPQIFSDEAQTIRRAWESRDPEGLRTAAHRLKGTASSLACIRLGQFCQSVQHEPEKALTNRLFCTELAQELADALEALAQLFPVSRT